MNVIDLFSGGGGLTEGFIREGFNIIAHVEKDKWACETLKTRLTYHFLNNNSDIALYKKYIAQIGNYKKIDENREIVFKKYPQLKKKLEYEVLNYAFGNPEEDKDATPVEEIIKKIEESMDVNSVSNIDLIIGGPPCQAYSLVGRGVMKQKAEADKRNYLFRYYKDIVNYFQPKAFVFENVPGILTAKKGKIYKAIVEEFNSIGYTLLSGFEKDCKKNIINAHDLGIPQTRNRVILFGYKKELMYNYPNIYKYKYEYEDLTTLSAIGDLPKIQHNQGKLGEILKYPQKENLSKYQKYIRDERIGVLNHQSRKHNDRDLRIYKLAINKSIKGEKLKYTDIPKEDRTHKNEKSFLDRFKVHGKNEIPHTILAHLAKDGHYNIHPDIEQCRSLTVREAARIQTFTDNYVFEGPRGAQFTQVGNAVPPLMAQSIAKAVKDVLMNK